MRLFAFFAIALSLMTGAAEAASIKSKAIGCKSKDDHSRLTRFIVQKDEKAFSEALSRFFRSGACRPLDPPLEVHIEDTAIFSGLVAVRPTGEPDAYWTNIEAVDTRQ